MERITGRRSKSLCPGIAITLVLATACGETRETTVPPSGPRDTVQAELIGVIGRVEGPEEQILGSVVAVAMDRLGTVYVADGQASSVRAYDESGAYLYTIGEEGDGPEEFRSLRALDIDARGSLYVWGRGRITEFAPIEDVDTRRVLSRTIRTPSFRSPRGVRGRADGELFYGPDYEFADFLVEGYHYVRFGGDGSVVDSFDVPAFASPESSVRANYATSPEGFGPNVEGINRVPFEPGAAWDLDDEGRLYFTHGIDFEITVVGSGGDTLDVIERPYRGRPIPEREWSDSAQAFSRRVAELPVQVDRLRGMSPAARAGEIPRVAPSILSVHASNSGDLWVRRWPRERRDETVFDVIARSGAPDRTVTVEAALSRIPPPWVSSTHVVGVVVDPDTRLETILIFRVPPD